MYVYACDTAGSAQSADKGVDGGVGSPFVVAEALDKLCHLVDGAHGVVVGAEQRDLLHVVAVFWSL